MGADGSTGGPICSAKNELEERQEEDTMWEDGDDIVVVGATKALIPVKVAVTANMAIDAALQIIIITE